MTAKVTEFSNNDSIGPEETARQLAKEVEIRRRLAAERPDTFLPELAVALNNLSSAAAR